MKKVFSKKITLIILGILLILIASFVIKKMTANNEIKEIQRVASDYFEQNGMYGFTTKQNEELNCSSARTFLRDDRIASIFAQPDVDNVSCRFKVENNMAKEWSVSIIKGEKVFCGDSTGANMMTPGITSTSNCKAE
jgi:cysteine synthase